jgi:hypothetical protein
MRPGNNYEYLSSITKRGLSNEASNRMSRILQSSGMQKMDYWDSRRNMNRSVAVNPHNHSVEKNNVPIFDQKKVHHNQSALHERFNRSLKDKYFQNASYISHPINQVKAPIISTTKEVFG